MTLAGWFCKEGREGVVSGRGVVFMFTHPHTRRRSHSTLTLKVLLTFTMEVIFIVKVTLIFTFMFTFARTHTPGFVCVARDHLVIPRNFVKVNMQEWA